MNKDTEKSSPCVSASVRDILEHPDSFIMERVCLSGYFWNLDTEHKVIFVKGDPRLPESENLSVHYGGLSAEMIARIDREIPFSKKPVKVKGILKKSMGVTLAYLVAEEVTLQ